MTDDAARLDVIEKFLKTKYPEFVPAGAAVPAPAPAPVISETVTVTTNSARFDWTVDPASPGQVSVSPVASPATVIRSTAETELRSRHIQTISGLTAGKEYDYEIASGSKKTGRFKTSAATTSVVSDIYGPGVAIDSKANLEIDGQLISHRFKASTTSFAMSHCWSQRFGPGGYAGGTGGKIRTSLMSDVNGLPGAVLAASLYTPNKPTSTHDTTFESQGFGTPPKLTKDTYYHLVYENIHSDPANNWVSVNEIFTYDGSSQPGMAGISLLRKAPGGSWRVDTKHVPVFDVIYQDGTHDGNAYIEAMWEKHAIIEGGAMCREKFKPKATQTRRELFVRPRRIYGTAPLVAEIYKAGNLVSTLQLAGSPTLTAVSMPSGTQAGLQGGRWVGGALASPLELTAGVEYELRLKTAVSTRYVMHPIRVGHTRGTIEAQENIWSRAWEDGYGAERNSASTWSQLYPWSPQDIQFYFR